MVLLLRFQIPQLLCLCWLKVWWRKEGKYSFWLNKYLTVHTSFYLFFVVNKSEILNINKEKTNNIPQIGTSGRVEISLLKLPYCLYLKDALPSESFGPGEEEMNCICLIVSFLGKQEWRSQGWGTGSFEALIDTDMSHEQDVVPKDEPEQGCSTDH